MVISEEVVSGIFMSHFITIKFYFKFFYVLLFIHDSELVRDGFKLSKIVIKFFITQLISLRILPRIECPLKQSLNWARCLLIFFILHGHDVAKIVNFIHPSEHVRVQLQQVFFLLFELSHIWLFVTLIFLLLIYLRFLLIFNLIIIILFL